ncbi:uncharacterized protein LOC119976517 [Scyliorhinus canicula]|uniref:uncharacterized protein LOC119976517 n=1 Tax=Scyliorhinus canicula TaxID=7830 RepID=UPI0018F6CB03|nr:uncharacterized protein LOC119976517 [Scyliorhinus canicula]
MPGDLEILNNIKNLLFSNDATAIKVVGNVLLFLILYGLEELLEKNIPCPCQESNTTANMVRHPHVVYSVLFFVFPSVVLLLISLLVQLRSREWHYCCNNCAACRATKLNTLTQAAASEYCWKCVILRIFLFGKVWIPSVIWIAVLFLDGDYFACAGLKDLNYTNCAAFNCSTINIHFRVKEQGLCEKSRLIGGILLTSFIIVMLILYGLRHRFNCDRRKNCKSYALEVEKQDKKLIMEELEKKATDTARTKFEENGRKKCEEVFLAFETQQNNSGAGTPDMANSPDTPHPSDSSTPPENQRQIEEEGQNTTSSEAVGSLLGDMDIPPPPDNSVHPKRQHPITEEEADVNVSNIFHRPPFYCPSIIAFEKMVG